MTAYFMLDFGPDWTATIDLTLLDNGQTRVEIFDVCERAADDEPTREIKLDADSGLHREIARQACHAIERKLENGFVVTEYETGRAYGGPEEGGCGTATANLSGTTTAPHWLKLRRCALISARTV